MYLKSMGSVQRIQFEEYGLDRIFHDFLDLWDDIFVKVNLWRRLPTVQVLLEVTVRQFIAVFKPPVVFRLLLNSVIGQMHKLIACVTDGINLGRCSQVPFRVVVPLYNPIKTSDHHEAPNVKFPTVYQKRISNVPLNYVSVFSGQWERVVNERTLYLLDILTDSDSIPSVRVFPWF